ncbi:pyruvate kinase [Kroppenstedtia eburnea]|uniref:Pyruvate kinase n=1 Tax=Kroppenstedtia eburnea TaxID=714067 RepID=A0A1N7MKP5_9BACL|nr:pyruvate kinase [Kroppenstedtia eburnea]QKI81632.1 pyruvate kinase [Kroppenstedtia eburnea]SIS86677.1 pyruvate kinase [Kroppenstedtia eburnea]
MRRTKIVCTIGPASEQPETLKKLVQAGMNVARLNFSHGTHEEHLRRIERIRQVEKELGQTIAILLDTKGPEIRTGILREEQVELKTGEEIILTTEEVEGDASRVSVSYKGMVEDVHPGSTILVDDGLISLQVEKVEGTEITCRIENGGPLKDRKGVNLPGVSLQLPGITEKDAEDIRFGIRHGVDFIAASFVRKPNDVLEIREILEAHDADIHIISKIENEEGVNNLDAILNVSDGIMVARGDLGVEIPAEEVPVLQKEMIRKCNHQGKPVITATQMLDSMQRNPRPTRAEASDVANAIFDGTDAVMLSGETASGKYPVEAVETMARISSRAEESLRYADLFQERIRALDMSIPDSISQSVVHTAGILKASAIITSTESGKTARMVSKYRPRAPIVAVTRHEQVMRHLALVWGIVSVKGEKVETTDEMLGTAIQSTIRSGYVRHGDLVVITAGVPVAKSGTTNLMKVHVIGDILAKGQGVGKKVLTGEVVSGVTAAELRSKMKDGAILVTRNTDKDMIDSFKRAAAVIVEQGGLTSHAAVVGLSLGIPVVVGVPGATGLFEDGMEITVDAERGHIYSGRANVL